jgi:hypothetical protein
MKWVQDEIVNGTFTHGECILAGGALGGRRGVECMYSKHIMTRVDEITVHVIYQAKDTER